MSPDNLIHRYTHTFRHHRDCYWCGLPIEGWLRFPQRDDYPDAPFRVIEQIRLSRR